MISKPLKGSLLVLFVLTVSGCASKSTNKEKSTISDEIAVVYIFKNTRSWWYYTPKRRC